MEAESKVYQGEDKMVARDREAHWQYLQQAIRDPTAVPQPGQVWTHTDSDKDYLVVGAGADVKERIVQVLYMGFDTLDLCIRPVVGWHDRFRLKTSGTVMGPPMADAYRKRAPADPGAKEGAKEETGEGPGLGWHTPINYRLGGAVREHFDQETEAVRVLWNRYHMLLGSARAWLVRAQAASELLERFHCQTEADEIARQSAHNELAILRDVMGRTLAEYRDR